jgi:membrane protein DedA with SNARE-associated domain
LEEIIRHIQSLDPLLVYLVLFSIALVENLFPPSPSDMAIVFGGTLVSIGRVNFIPALLWATAGSTAGFMIMYKVGEWFGERILEKKEIKFIPLEAVKKVEDWFARYGYWIIVANRFLAGTRAVVSFFAGMSELKLGETTLLCFLSALAWNSVLLSAGYLLGTNWERIGFFLSTYSQIVTAIVVVAVLIWAIRYFSQKNGKQKKA